MLGANPRRLRRLGVAGAEGGRLGEVARVGAPADGVGLAVRARVLVVGVEERADLGRARVGVEGRHVPTLLVLGAVGAGKLGEHGGDGLAGGRLGVAGVDGLHEAAALGTHGAADAGERPEEAVCGRDAQARPVSRGEDGALELEEVALGPGYEAVVEQVADEHADRVQRARGHAGVPSPAVGRELAEAVRRGLHVDALGCGELGGIRAHERGGEARDRVADGAAVELDDDPAPEGPGVEALLAADQREVSIGGEEELGLRVVGEVVVHVAHVGLLVAAHNRAQGQGQALPGALDMALEEVGGVERHHEGALVVEDAAADEVAVLARDVQGIEGPTNPERHYVGVRDGGEVALRGARQVREADVALAVVRLEAEPRGHLEAATQCLAGRLAPGTAGRRALEVLDGLDLHEVVDVSYRVLPDLVDVGVDLGLELLVCHVSLLTARVRAALCLHDPLVYRLASD